jgi:hypothetical protein
MRRRAGWKRAAAARVAAAIAQFGGVLPMPPDSLDQDQDNPGVDGGEGGGEQAVDQGAVDDSVDVVQPVLEDGHPDGDWDQRETDRKDQRSQHRTHALGHPEEKDEIGGDDEGEPLELLAFLTPGATKPHHHRGQRRQHQGRGDDAGRGLDEPQQALGRLNPERVLGVVADTKIDRPG